MHDVLSGIKQRKVASISSDHQSLEKIGSALVAAYPDIPDDWKGFVVGYAARRMESICPDRRHRVACRATVCKFLNEDENLVSMDQSNSSRIGEQFLELIDFLSKSVEDPERHPEQWLANDFLSTLHHIAVTGRV